MRNIRYLSTLLLSVLGLLAQSVAPAQPQDSSPLFPTIDYFHTMFQPRHRYKLELPATLRDHVRDGVLRLSLADVTQLAVSRSTDVWLARLDVQQADSSVIRAFGPFDPQFAGSFNSGFSSLPTFSELVASKELFQSTSVGITQLLATGATYNVGFTGTKTSSNSGYDFLNPALTAALNFSISQPLLRGRGVFLNRAPILIARINRQVARDRFEQLLTGTLQSVQNQYWDTVNARESLAVARHSLELAETFYKRDKRSLELGALPPLDIYRSEADVANRKVAVTSAEYFLKQQEDALRRLISADMDPAVRSLPLDLTDAPATTEVSFPPPDAAVELSWRKRPELTQLHRQQTIYETNERVNLNELKPNLAIGANYSSNGLGGDNLITGVLVPGGFNDALRQAFGFGSPTYGFTLSLNLPLRNHQAAADVVDAEINLKRNIYTQRTLEQQIALDVRTALNSLEQSRLNIVGAVQARDLAKKSLEAEQRKYELGSGQVNFVLDAQQRLSDAENQLLQAMIGYRKAVISVQRATGTLLDDNHVVLQQALGG
jgi:outer membrane protein